jgi:hypothetical protein
MEFYMILYATLTLSRYLNKEISPHTARQIISKLKNDELKILIDELDLAFFETGDESIRKMKSALRQLRVRYVQ